jgi:hypothetical protein
VFVCGKFLCLLELYLKRLTNQEKPVTYSKTKPLLSRLENQIKAETISLLVKSLPAMLENKPAACEIKSAARENVSAARKNQAASRENAYALRDNRYASRKNVSALCECASAVCDNASAMRENVSATCFNICYLNNLASTVGLCKSLSRVCRPRRRMRDTFLRN